MIRHYLKLATRNLLKYKMQTLISVVGLAIGLACFALSSFWIQYEMTYDTFHKDAERIYLIRMDDSFSGYTDRAPYPLGEYLKRTYSEIEDYCAFDQQQFHVLKNKKMQEYNLIKVDSTFIRMMEMRILEGNNGFFQLNKTNSDEVAITEEMAYNMFGTTKVIGKTIIEANSQRELRIGAIVSDWGKHSNFKYSAIKLMTSSSSWDDSTCKILIKVSPETNIDVLLEKLNHSFPNELKTNKYGSTGHTHFSLSPITGLRYTDGFVRNDETVLQFKYIVYISLTGILIIVCAFVNYLTIYAERFRTRKREMALRKVNGASEFSLLCLLTTEFILTLLLVSIVGMIFIEILMPWFLHYSMIDEPDISVYGNCLLYIGGMAVLTLAIAVLSIYIFRKHSLHHVMLNSKVGWMGVICRKGSIVVQLVVCLLFILSTVIMQMQLYHLRNVDTGIEYRNRAAVSIWMNVDMNVWAEKVKALPMVTEVVRPIYWPLISMGGSSVYTVNSWDGAKGTTEKQISLDQILAGEEFFKFYNMKLLTGEWISEKSDNNDINIMESTAHAMGWNPQEAIGKHIYCGNKEMQPFTVIGVVKDCGYKSPSTDLPHAAFVNTYKEKWAWFRCFVLFKYKPGTWEECRQRIEEMQQEELPNHKLFLDSEEERYNKFLKSEDALSTLLSFSSIICILISIFGVYSLVTLSCEQRRKEIAIRKVNGATILDILGLFFKEYTLLLVISSLIAFPIGYFIMKLWIETYNRQIEIGILPFVAIFIGIVIILSVSVGHRIWQAARQNPAEVIKNE